MRLLALTLNICPLDVIREGKRGEEEEKLEAEIGSGMGAVGREKGKGEESGGLEFKCSWRKKKEEKIEFRKSLLNLISATVHAPSVPYAWVEHHCCCCCHRSVNHSPNFHWCSRQ